MQVYQIFIQVIRSKFIAVLLGPLGVGILGLYLSAIDLVKQITSLGLSQSAVRDVSEANGSGDFVRISRTVTILRRLVWVTGILACLALAFFSPILSKTTFGNNDYTIPFICLSVTLLLDQLCSGQKVVLQGMRKLKDLAKATLIGSTIGLMVSIPLYYLFGVKGIVPTLILNSITTLIIVWAYSRKIKIEKTSITLKETFVGGKNMMIMGIAMSFSSILTATVSYVVRGYIRNSGGAEEVGLYQAGFAIITSYVGLVFNAISTDYYPRLAAVNMDNEKCREVISQQGEIGVMVIAPLLTICLIFMPFVLRILYSDKFLPANDFIAWSCLGMMFRLSSWIISYQFVAKAESKLFMINETVTNILYLSMSILGYKIWGLTGLGIAFAANYILYFVQVYVISKIRYGFSFSNTFIKEYLIQLIFVVSALLIVLQLDGWIRYTVGCLVILVSSLLAIRGLDKKIGLLSLVRNLIQKIK